MSCIVATYPETSADLKIDLEHYMRQAIAFAQEKNPVWPFATVLVNSDGDIICKATDCAHISPLYHAESSGNTCVDSTNVGGGVCALGH